MNLVDILDYILKRSMQTYLFQNILCLDLKKGTEWNCMAIYLYKYLVLRYCYIFIHFLRQT